jgi:predicted nucleic acid-binding protein
MGNDVLSQLGAWQVYDRLCRDIRVGFVAELPQMESIFRQLTKSRQKATGGWTDAYLAAVAKARGLTIVSFDRAFGAMEGVEAVILPLS